MLKVQKCREYRVQQYAPDGATMEWPQETLTEVQKTFDVINSIDPEVTSMEDKRNSLFSLAITAAAAALLPEAKELSLVTVEMIDMAISSLRDIASQYEAEGVYQKSHQFMLLLAYFLWMKAGFSDQPAADEALVVLTAIERSFRKRASYINLSLGNGRGISDEFTTKVVSAERLNHDKVFAIDTSIAISQTIMFELQNRDQVDTPVYDQRHEELYMELVDWMQKSKARALVDLFGSAGRYPAWIWPYIIASTEAQAFL